MNKRRFLLYFLITLTTLAIICAAILLLVSIKRAIKTHAKELTFEENIEAMIKEHRLMADRLIKNWEHRQEEINLLAEVIYHENWHTDKEHLAAYYTGAVVMNRVKSKVWPNTVKDVLYQKNPIQYSTTSKFFTKEIPPECYEMARDIYRNGTPDVPYDVVFQATFKQGSGDWIDPINGEHFCYGKA